eukprot:14507806-Alexandrium_andersonii.AAC.1
MDGRPVQLFQQALLECWVAESRQREASEAARRPPPAGGPAPSLAPPPQIPASAPAVTSGQAGLGRFGISRLPGPAGAGPPPQLATSVE